MGKTQLIKQLTNLLSKALRHKIGSMVNSDEFYTAKYAKDYEVLFREALRIYLQYHWNKQDLSTIRLQVGRKLHKELKEKEFIADKKFEIMDEQLEEVIQRLVVTIDSFSLSLEPDKFYKGMLCSPNHDKWFY